MWRVQIVANCYTFYNFRLRLLITQFLKLIIIQGPVLILKLVQYNCSSVHHITVQYIELQKSHS